MKTFTKYQKRRGFTLVELLVVIALVATLAGLAIIGVRKGLTAAAAGKTAKNMKEIYNALETITSEGVNTGLHPPNSFAPAAGTMQDNGEPDFLWWDLVAEKLTFADRDGGQYEWAQRYQDTILQNPLSKLKLGGDKSDWDSLYNDPDLTHGSYAYNAELGGDVSANADSEQADVVSQARIEDEPSTIYFGEADDESDTVGYIFKGVADAPQGNYKDSAHCMFLDGAVRQIKNTVLKDPSSLDFYTKTSGKNFSNQP